MIIEEYIDKEFKNIMNQIKKFIRLVKKEYQLHSQNYSKDQIFERRNKLNDYGSTTSEYIKSTTKIKQMFIDIQNIITEYFTLHTDLYTMRRILDKVYVKKSILYVGHHHLCQLVYHLVKYFGFEITNSFYQDEEIPDINRHIRNLKGFDYKDFAFITPPFLTQCTNMKGFPDLFM